MKLPDFPIGLRLPLAAVALAAAAGVSAAPVDVSRARSEAVEFLRAPMHGRKAVKGTEPDMTLAYTSTAGSTDCFYVFNYASGYVIVSADTRLPDILGYSDSGTFDPDNMPENMRWWLGEYTREISAFLPTAPESLSATRRLKRAGAERASIEPLTKTKWNQDSPYNDLCPIDRTTGERSVTGCVATAMAQVLKYHEWPKQPTGSSAGVVLDGTTYDWANMLDVYESGKYNSAQGQAVATLMRQCGAAVNMQYSSYASGAYDMNVQVALRKNFNYSPDLKMRWKDYTPLTKWQDMVYAELAAGRPVYYSGASSYGGHAFVCDGYSENNYFHFNWGWGGFQDGYFLLTALNPATGGAGSYEGGYNSGQIIMTGVTPNTTGATAAEQAALLATGGFIYSGSGTTFTIERDAQGFALIYNPMAYAETVQIALEITSVDNPDTPAQYVRCGGSTLLKSLQGVAEMSASMPRLADGLYEIRPVFAAGNSSEYEPILIPLGQQNYVSLTMAGGNATFANLGPDDSNTPYLFAGTPTSVTATVLGNAPMAFRVPVINYGKGDYLGRIGLTLMDSEDDFGDAVSMTFDCGIPGRSGAYIDLTTPQHLSMGTYEAIVTDEDDQIIGRSKITVKLGNFPDITSTDLMISAISPSFVTSGRDYAIACDVINTTIYPQVLQPIMKVLDATTMQEVTTITYDKAVMVPANATGRASTDAITFDIAPGHYYWYMTDTENQILSECTPLIVESTHVTSGGLTYMITDEKAKEATLCVHESGAYEGNINVPASIDGYSIISVRNDAFTFGETPEVTLPAAVTYIPTGLFYSNTALTSLTLNAPAVAECGESAFNAGQVATIWLNVPDAVATAYHDSEAWNPFSMTNWACTLGAGISVASGFHGSAAPYYVNALTPHDITFANTAGNNVKYVIEVNGVEVDANVLDPAAGTVLRLPALGLRGQGHITASATDEPASVALIQANDGPADVFTVDGRLIIRGADADALRSLAPGIYIVAGRKLIVH